MAWAAAIGSVIEAVQRRQFRSADNRIEANRATEEYERQKEFAKMGIRWKVEDAKAAGLHPLAALGSQTTSYNPNPIGVDSTGYLGNFSEMGQNISRAMNAGKTQQEQDAAAAELRIKNATADSLEYDLQRKKNADQNQTPFPSEINTGILSDEGQTDLNNEGSRFRGWKFQDNTVTPSASDAPGRAAGPPSAFRKGYRDTDGEWIDAMDKDAAESIESDEANQARLSLKGYANWIGNSVMASLMKWVPGLIPEEKMLNFLNDLARRQPNIKYARPGYEWRYSHWTDSFWETKIGKEGHQLFIDDRFWNMENNNKYLPKGLGSAKWGFY